MTDFNGLTAALVNPPSVPAIVDATHCDIGIYFNQGPATVRNSNIFGAGQYGIVVNGDFNIVNVDILDNLVHNTGDNPFTGDLHGVGIYYRSYFGGHSLGKISGNTINMYQLGGILANGTGTNVTIMGNTITGFGPVALIPQVGIQIGYGAAARISRNIVSAHSYTGIETVAGGILIVGGPGYGTCPDGSPCPYTDKIEITGNTAINNDVGVFLTNLAADGLAPPAATNVKVVNNVVTNDALTNGYGGYGYQAGVSDVGNNDKIVGNTISGAGYDPLANPGGYTVAIDADPLFTNRPKVHANR